MMIQFNYYFVISKQETMKVAELESQKCLLFQEFVELDLFVNNHYGSFLAIENGYVNQD